MLVVIMLDSPSEGSTVDSITRYRNAVASLAAVVAVAADRLNAPAPAPAPSPDTIDAVQLDSFSAELEADAAKLNAALGIESSAPASSADTSSPEPSPSPGTPVSPATQSAATQAAPDAVAATGTDATAAPASSEAPAGNWH